MKKNKYSWIPYIIGVIGMIGMLVSSMYTTKPNPINMTFFAMLLIGLGGMIFFDKEEKEVKVRKSKNRNETRYEEVSMKNKGMTANEVSEKIDSSTENYNVEVWHIHSVNSNTEIDGTKMIETTNTAYNSFKIDVAKQPNADRFEKEYKCPYCYSFNVTTSQINCVIIESFNLNSKTKWKAELNLVKPFECLGYGLLSFILMLFGLALFTNSYISYIGITKFYHGLIYILIFSVIIFFYRLSSISLPRYCVFIFEKNRDFIINHPKAAKPIKFVTFINGSGPHDIRDGLISIKRTLFKAGLKKRDFVVIDMDSQLLIK